MQLAVAGAPMVEAAHRAAMMTGQPTGRPSAVAASGRSAPITASAGRIGGSRARSKPTASISVADQSRRARSISPTVVAAAGSVTISPVRRNAR